MPKISIIVPVFNVQAYIHRCIDSILKQTFSDFELILVDDGSSDFSGMICDEYANNDSRICVIHKINGGLSDARNVGIDHARGQYLAFVDGDDYIADDMYEILINALERTNADLAICGIYDVYGEKKPHEKPVIHKVLNRESATKFILEGNIISVHAVNKLYKRKIFNKLRYPVGKYHEDSYVILDILKQCQSVVVDSVQKYFYVHREGSINTETFSPKQFDFINAWTLNEEKLINSSRQLRHAAHQRVCFAHFLVLDKMIQGHATKQYEGQAKEIVSYLRKNFLFIMKDHIFTKSRKISLIFLILNINLYGLVIGLYYKN